MAPLHHKIYVGKFANRGTSKSGWGQNTVYRTIVA
jgi:hypothetical protein